MMSKQVKVAQRNLGLGYSTPIIGAVVALLTGLIVSDLTQTSLDIWVWVLIQVILGVGMVLGTRFSTSAFNFATSHKRKLGAIKGARNLNLILGIVWSVVVTIMSFANGAMAVSNLVRWPEPTKFPEDGTKPVVSVPDILPLTTAKFLENFVPAFVLILIAVSGIYLLLAERSREAKPRAGAASEA
jgi:hypothetical protein